MREALTEFSMENGSVQIATLPALYCQKVPSLLRKWPWADRLTIARASMVLQVFARVTRALRRHPRPKTIARFFAVAEGRCWMAIRISSGSVRTPSFALSWVQVLATVL